MDFVGNLLNNTDGISWFYIAGLLIFIALFIVILYRTFRMQPKDIRRYKESILDSNEITKGK